MEDILTIFHIEKATKSELKTEGNSGLERYWMKNEGLTASDLISGFESTKKWRCDDAAMLQSLSTRALQAARENQHHCQVEKSPYEPKEIALSAAERVGRKTTRSPKLRGARIEILSQ
jgi:hypothetical protein